MILHPARIKLLLLLLALALCALLWFVAKFEKQIVAWAMPTKGWVEFKVPEDARQIRATVQRSPEGLNICNVDALDWTDVTVKLLGIYNTPYLAQPKPIRAGTCEYVAFSQFAEPSWKRMSMPPNQTIARVELLVTYRGIGYTSLTLK